jgi:hypothetical protein
MILATDEVREAFCERLDCTPEDYMGYIDSRLKRLTKHFMHTRRSLSAEFPQAEKGIDVKGVLQLDDIKDTVVIVSMGTVMPALQGVIMPFRKVAGGVSDLLPISRIEHTWQYRVFRFALGEQKYRVVPTPTSPMYPGITAYYLRNLP